MSNDADGALHGASKGGVAGNHPEAAPFEFFVSPATSTETNTAHLRLIPVGCWRVDDIRFAFDSSFVTADVTTELQMLVTLREAKKKLDASGKAQYPPLSVFGHADPVGTDDYNKALSGRRATAVYALLISRTEPEKASSLWQQIANAENWGADQRQAMQTKTGLPSGTSDSDLFKGYMQKLCPDELQLSPTDFLAQGADGGGKGDYQGCSEFNPLLIFSQTEESDFEQASDKTARNRANAQNRRVLVLLFRPGSKVLPSKWPCPRATEGKAGCLKRFWSDGESRRSRRLPDQEREYKITHDTFGCRFFDRLSKGSPCDHAISFKIRLYDGKGVYIPNAPCTVAVGDQAPYSDKADANGIIVLQQTKLPQQCHIQWGLEAMPEKKPDLIFSLDMLLVNAEEDEDSEMKKKLNNLGYTEADRSTNIRRFQEDYGHLENPTLKSTGQLDSSTAALIRKTYKTCADNLGKNQLQAAG